MFYIDTFLDFFVFALLIFFSVSFSHLYYQWTILPPGPFPLPVIGNILSFCSRKHVKEIMNNFKEKYGSVYTLWFGSAHFVIINDWKHIKEARVTRKNDIISKPQLRSTKPFLEYLDTIVMEENTKKWEISRKIGHASSRKFADQEKLANIVQNNVAKSVQQMEIKSQFNPTLDIEIMVLGIIAEVTFGAESLTKDEFDAFNGMSQAMHENLGKTPGDVCYPLLPFFYHRELAIRRACKAFGEVLTTKFQENKNTYEPGNYRNFIDTVLKSSQDSREKEENLEYLIDDNLKKIVGILFLGGTDTSVLTLTWIYLILASYPDVQRKIREELLANIGKRMPVQDDRHQCPYTWAVISETLRLRPPVPLGGLARANKDTVVGGYKIRKGTNIIFNYGSAQVDPALWSESEEFKPERFLDSEGSYRKTKIEGFSAFGLGGRRCIGEKLAINMIFLIMANLLRKFEISLVSYSGKSTLETQNNPVFNLSVDYQVKLIPVLQL